MDKSICTILAIDDNPDNLITISALLHYSFPDYTIYTALSGEKGLELAATHDPDVILLDVIMRDMNGYEVCRKLKARSDLRDIPVVFVTALKDRKESRILALECGAEGFLYKPIDEIELTAIVRAMIKIKTLHINKREETARLSALVEEKTTEIMTAHKATLHLLREVRRENEARKKSEEALRTSEAKFRAMVETMPLAIHLLAGNEQRSEYVNPTFISLFGYTLEDVPTIEHWWPLAYPDEQYRNHIAEEWNARVERAVEQQSSIEPMEVVVACKDGSTRNISWGYVPLGDRSYNCGLDLTERKRAEEATVAAKERAEKSEKLKDVFIANISHEIRTPLNIILGFANVIEERFLPFAESGDRGYFESLERGGERLMRTVDMILNVSRLQAGEYILKPSKVNIPELVRNVVANHSHFAEQKHLLLTSIDECDSAIVMVDEYCVTQAMNNLLNNAIKFTATGEVAVRVFKDPTGRVNISCRDTGIGIAPSYFPTLFSRYSQEQSGFTRPFEGLGLGMALVKEYLTLNNATVSVESEKGSGTTFTVTFQNGGIPTRTPITGEQPEGAASTTEPPHTLRDQGPTSGSNDAAPAMAGTALPQPAEGRYTVLLVEDDEMTIEYMKMVLQSKWELLTAHDSVEAWEVLYRSPIDIILMDVSLSGEQTGMELTHDIRQSKAHGSIPIIAVTAHAYDSDRVRCLEAGCNEFIPKPIVRAVLLASMERLLAR